MGLPAKIMNKFKRPRVVEVSSSTLNLPGNTSSIEIAAASAGFQNVDTISIPGTYAGDELTILGTSAINLVRFRDNQVGTNLALGATTRTLGDRSRLSLKYSSDGYWVEENYVVT